MIHLTEIEKKIYDRYPITTKEKNCRYERQKRNWLREQYKKELLEQAANSKQEYHYQPEI